MLLKENKNNNSKEWFDKYYEKIEKNYIDYNYYNEKYQYYQFDDIDKTAKSTFGEIPQAVKSLPEPETPSNPISEPATSVTPQSAKGVQIDADLAVKLIQFISEPGVLDNMLMLQKIDKHQQAEWLANQLQKHSCQVENKKNEPKSESKELPKPTPEQIAQFVHDFIQT